MTLQNEVVQKINALCGVKGKVLQVFLSSHYFALFYVQQPAFLYKPNKSSSTVGSTEGDKKQYDQYCQTRIVKTLFKIAHISFKKQ